MKYSVMHDSAMQYQIKITEVHIGDITNFLDFQKDLQAKENIEGTLILTQRNLLTYFTGVVIRFEDDGSMYKVKTTWYFQKSHKEKQEFSLGIIDKFLPCNKISNNFSERKIYLEVNIGPGN